MNFLLNNLVYSPLEQFEDVTWVFYSLILDSVEAQGFYLFELEENLFRTSVLNKDSFFMDTFYPLLFVLLYFFLNVKKETIKDEDITNFSHLFLVAFITFISGFVFSVWFSDIVFFNTTVNSADLVTNTSLSLNSFEYLVLPQISFAISWDENLISFFGALLLLDDDGEDDFILEEEGSDFVEDVVAPLFIANLGKDVQENGALFLKVCGIFSFVLVNNLMGMLPYSDTGTSSLILTFWVAFSVFVSLLTLMIKKHGINYFFGLFMPSGCPLPLIFVLIPIEFISYSFRLVSLSVRLFANMMAGHTLLKVIVGFSWSMILMGDLFLIANLFPMAILFVLTFLELGVAMIQSYIFTILTCIYLKDIFVAH